MAFSAFIFPPAGFARKIPDGTEIPAPLNFKKPEPHLSNSNSKESKVLVMGKCLNFLLRKGKRRIAKGSEKEKNKLFIAGPFLKDLNTCGKCENEIRKRFIESQSLQLKLNVVRKVAFHF